MARRRQNHGHPVAVGVLAEKALAALVPPDRLRLVRLQLAWVEAMPPRLEGVAVPAGLDGDVVLVHVLNNQWLHELTYLRADLLARLRERCPGVPLPGLRLRVGPIPQVLPPVLDPPPPQIPPLPLQPAPATVEAIAGIEDPRLRQAVATARQSLTHLGRG